MSAATARAAATPRTARPQRVAARPSYLRLVTTRRSRAAKAPFVAVVIGILAVGLLGLLLLNTVLAQDAFQLHALQLQGHVLADQEQALQRDVERLQSPASLAQRATALGMVQGGPPAFLRLSDGKVLGAPAPGTAPIVPVATTAVSQVVTTAKTTVATVARKAPPKPAAGTWVVVPHTGGKR